MTPHGSKLQMPLILASTSPYRRELLGKLGLSFEAKAPICDEDEFKKIIKDPVKLATTLAFEKAKSLATSHNIVIGGDQLVSMRPDDVSNGVAVIFGKPKTAEKAAQQLSQMSGKTHELVTAVCVFVGGEPHPLLNITRLKMRKLTGKEIENYIGLDQPMDSAGSYKIEKSGLTLFEKIECEDFSAIQGLPLMALTSLLAKWGFEIPGPHADKSGGHA